MKGPRTSVAAEQWSLSAAHLTVARVFLLEEEIMRVLLGSAPGDFGLHRPVGTRPRFLPLLHKQRAQTAAISCPRVLLGSTHLCGHRGRAAARLPQGDAFNPQTAARTRDADGGSAWPFKPARAGGQNGHRLPEPEGTGRSFKSEDQQHQHP